MSWLKFWPFQRFRTLPLAGELFGKENRCMRQTRLCSTQQAGLSTLTEGAGERLITNVLVRRAGCISTLDVVCRMTGSQSSCLHARHVLLYCCTHAASALVVCCSVSDHAVSWAPITHWLCYNGHNKQVTGTVVKPPWPLVPHHRLRYDYEC